MLENITITTPILVALITGIVEVAKWAGLNSRYAGVLAVLFGIGQGILAYYVGMFGLYEGIMGGIIIGLVASGAYSGTKSLLK